ncbi:hypothetical protein [Rhodococcus sp. NPDC049939]|uniref:hypothetical protein n=1 Tax=Rhodococcus sp. NPDC049939 TaxID=3155511 RepID=UPI0034084FFC
MAWEELLDRFDRYTADLDEDTRRHIEMFIQQDAYVLTALISKGLERGDLSDEDIDAALEFAKRHHMMRSLGLTDALEELKASRAST